MYYMKHRTDVLPEIINLGSFTLTVHASGSEAAIVAASFQQTVKATFAAKNRLLALLYDIEIEEGDVWSGSRKSRVRGRLKKKKRTNPIARLWVAGLTALTLASTDYTQVPKNFHAVVNTVQEWYHHQGQKTSVSEFWVDDSVDDPPPFEEGSDR